VKLQVTGAEDQDYQARQGENLPRTELHAMTQLPMPPMNVLLVMIRDCV
jgi:hypothetical protein